MRESCWHSSCPNYPVLCEFRAAAKPCQDVRYRDRWVGTLVDDIRKRETTRTCQHCGRSWTGPRGDLFGISAIARHIESCARRSPKTRRRVNTRSTLYWKRNPPKLLTTNDPDHPGLRDVERGTLICPHCGRSWTGLKVNLYGRTARHVASCEKRTPKRRRRVNVTDESRWRRRGMKLLAIRNDPDHPGLKEIDVDG